MTASRTVPRRHTHSADDITSGRFPLRLLGSGTPTAGTVLHGDGTWAVPVASLADGDYGDITVASSGAAWTIDAQAVTFGKIQNVATARIAGRATAGNGSLEELTGTQATALLDTFTSGDKGLAPTSGGGTTNFLRADGTWAAPAGGSATDLSYTAATRVLASSTGADATLPLVTSGDAGLAPASGGGTTNFLRADATWAAPAAPAFRGALVYRSTTQSFSALTWGVMSWDTEDYDTDAIWDIANPTRLTVPSGVTKVRLVCGFSYNTTDDVLMQFRKNQTTAAAATIYPGIATASWDPDFNAAGGMSSPVLTVTGGDWFDLAINARLASTAVSQSTWMSMEILQ